MMSAIFFIVDLLLKPREATRFLFARILGSFLLLLGVVFGIYFIFQALVPIIGYLQTGALLCALFIGGGFLLIFLSRNRRTRPIDDIVGEAQKAFENINGEELIKNNIHKILLFSLVAGLALSQLKCPKNLSQLKNFKKWLK